MIKLALVFIALYFCSLISDSPKYISLYMGSFLKGMVFCSTNILTPFLEYSAFLWKLSWKHSFYYIQKIIFCQNYQYIFGDSMYNAQSILLSKVNNSIFLKSVVQNGIMLKISLNMMWKCCFFLVDYNQCLEHYTNSISRDLVILTIFSCCN